MSLRLVLALVSITLISSFTPVAVKLAAVEISPLSLAFIRFGLAGVLLYIVMRLRGRRFTFDRADWRRVAVLGLLSVPINQPLFLGGAHLSSAAHTALIYALTPVFVFLLSLLNGRERATAMKTAGIVLSTAGIALIVLYRGLVVSSDMLLGDLMLVGAVMSWSLYVVLSKPLIARYGPLPTLTGSMLVGSLMYLPIFLYDAPHVVWGAVSPLAWANFAYLSVVTSAVGFLVLNWTLARLDASKVSVMSNLSPILTILFGVVWLHETLSGALVVGGAATLTGIFLTQRG